MDTELRYEDGRLRRDIEREAAKLVRRGIPLYAAFERAMQIVKEQRRVNDGK